MDLHSQIVAVYPELNDSDFDTIDGIIKLKDDGDGIQYLAKWDYSKPIPEGLSLGKP
jgi:hypothetical protein